MFAVTYAGGQVGPRLRIARRRKSKQGATNRLAKLKKVIPPTFSGKPVFLSTMKYSFDEYDTDEVSDLIDRKIHNEQYRKILKLRFNDKLTYQQIADNPDVKITSFRQVGKIIADYAPLLKELLRK